MVDVDWLADQMSDGCRAWAPAWTAKVLGALRRAQRNRRTRWQLSRLDDDGLRDVGISHASAKREVRKSFPFHGSP